MKATGIVRRVDDLGRIVIPKEIRRTLRIREGDPSQTTLTPFDVFLQGIIDFAQRITTEYALHKIAQPPTIRSAAAFTVRQIGI